MKKIDKSNSKVLANIPELYKVREEPVARALAKEQDISFSDAMVVVYLNEIQSVAEAENKLEKVINEYKKNKDKKWFDEQVNTFRTYEGFLPIPLRILVGEALEDN